MFSARHMSMDELSELLDGVKQSRRVEKGHTGSYNPFDNIHHTVNKTAVPESKIVRENSQVNYYFFLPGLDKTKISATIVAGNLVIKTDEGKTGRTFSVIIEEDANPNVVTSKYENGNLTVSFASVVKKDVNIPIL